MEKYNELIGHYYYNDDYSRFNTITNIIRLNRGYLIEYFENDHISHDILDDIKMEKIYQDYLVRKQRQNILINRDIRDIVHFTKVDNLDSILEYGLMSREYLDMLSIDYSYSDPYRFDNKLDFISTSISFPNYKMFYKKRMDDTSEKWAIIRISPSIIVHKLNTEFYEENRGCFKLYRESKYYTSNDALESLFTDVNRSSNIPSSYTTNPQAEVMIRDNIHTDYISCIETLGESDKVKSLTRNVGIPYNSNSRLFTYRSDFERWR